MDTNQHEMNLTGNEVSLEIDSLKIKRLERMT